MPGGQLPAVRQEGLGLPKYEPPAPNDEDRKVASADDTS